MSVLTTATWSAASRTPPTASSAPGTSTRISSFPGGDAIFGILDSVLMFFVPLTVDGIPLYSLAFKRGTQ